MIKLFLNTLDRLFPPQVVYAHCDIPCGIYDPHLAQVAAHTVLRMTSLINELPEPKPSWKKKEADDWGHKLSRYTSVKEEHAEVVKNEVRVIWGDYFKPEHIEKHGNLHDLVFEAMKLASKSRQEVNKEVADQLLSKVQEFAEIFWQTKGLKTKRCASTFPTEGEIVVPVV